MQRKPWNGEADLLAKETMVGYLQSEAPRMAAQLVAG